MELNLRDKVILVSGGGKGIGAAIVSTLYQEGAIPIIIGRNEADNQALVSKLALAPGRYATIAAELSDPKACKNAVDEALNQLHRIDGLVNNAGVNDGVGLIGGSYDRFMQSLHNNLVHYYLLAHHAIPHIIKQRGAIVNITSKTAETGQGGTSAYAAANGGRNALVREWAVELAPHYVRVNGVVVSECWTPAYVAWAARHPQGEALIERVKAAVPYGHRMTAPEEIAKAVTFLLSDASSHTTGQLLHVDGGYVHLDRALLGQSD